MAVVEGFLGSQKAENYAKLVADLVKNYGKMGCLMSLKVHILDSYLDDFHDNMGAYSKEQGERFHQDIMDFERRYQGVYNENMMGDYIWGLIRESDLHYSRKTRKPRHFKLYAVVICIGMHVSSINDLLKTIFCQINANFSIFCVFFNCIILKKRQKRCFLPIYQLFLSGRLKSKV